MSQRSELILKLARNNANSKESSGSSKLRWEVIHNKVLGRSNNILSTSEISCNSLICSNQCEQPVENISENDNIISNIKLDEIKSSKPVVDDSVASSSKSFNRLNFSVSNEKEDKHLSLPMETKTMCIGHTEKDLHTEKGKKKSLEVTMDSDNDDDNNDPFANSDDSSKDPDYLYSSDNGNSEIEEERQDLDQLHQDNTEKKTKKRKRDKFSWKKNAAKIARNTGMQYVSSSKSRKVIKAREMGPPCNNSCKLSCNTKICDEFRKEIFENFWALGDAQRQRDFLSACMTPLKPKYQYHRNEMKRRDNNAFYFTIKGSQIRVCKTFFKSTLNITDRPIRTVISKRNEVGGMLSSDLRGKHGKHHKLDANIKEGIRAHINAIPRIESHYTRARSSCEFIEGGKSVRDLHRDYVSDCTENNLPYGKYLMYYHLFTREYNISFYTPKKDQCSTCATYSNAGPEEKETLKSEFEMHLSEKDLSRLEKQSDKQQVSENYILACFDLQAVLPCPKGDTSTFYYKSKLNVLNFTVYEIKQKEISDQCYCYIWDETQGQRGANEIGTCLFKYIEKKSQENLDREIDIVLYSDNCVGQQKNRFIITMYMFALTKFNNIKSITHKFLIVGHTQNEGDNAHSLIERQVKRSLKSGPIFVPAEYIGIIKSAKKTGNPYLVTEMSYADFYDLKRLNENIGKIDNKDLDGKVSDMKVIRIERENPFQILFKTSYAQDDYTLLPLKRPRGSGNTNVLNLAPLYKNKLKISDQKKKGLMELVRLNHIPNHHAAFYKNL